MWLRIRYAEYVGTRFTREGARSHFPIVLLNFGGATVFGAFFGASVVQESLPLALLSGGLFLLLLLFSVTGLRMLVGYWRTGRYPVMLDLWSDSEPKPWRGTDCSPVGRAVFWSEPSREAVKPSLFSRLESALWLVFLWFCVLVVWLSALALLFGLIVGEFPHGASPAG